MKSLSILFLTIFLFLQTNAQIKIYDGRSESANTKISKQEKQLVENFVRKNEKYVKRFAESREFKCEKESFQVDSVAEGFFTRKRLRQKAYLYSFCYSGQAQYAMYLGGIVVVENNEPSGHYIFANIHGYNNIKSFTDINRNGYSEISLELHHSLSGHKFVRAIKIFDLAPSGLMEIATLDIFSRLGEDDSAFRIYVKKGNTPLFSRETYNSETEGNNWVLMEKRKPFATNPSVYTSESLDILPIYEFSAPTLTATEISQRVLKLIKSVQTVNDISPQNIEKIIGLKMQFDPDDRKNYGTSGRVADTTWFYALRSLSELDGRKPRRVMFSFNDTEKEDSSLNPVCAVDFENYKKELLAAGFSATERTGEHGRRLGWTFSNLVTDIYVTDYLEDVAKPNRSCVKSLIIQTNYKKPLLEFLKTKKGN